MRHLRPCSSLVLAMLSVVLAAGCGSSSVISSSAPPTSEPDAGREGGTSNSPDASAPPPKSDFTVTAALDTDFFLYCQEPITGDGIRATMHVTIENRGRETLPPVQFTRGRFHHSWGGDGIVATFTPDVDMAPLPAGESVTLKVTFVPGTLVPAQRCTAPTANGTSPIVCQSVYRMLLVYERDGEEQTVSDTGKFYCDLP